MKCDSEFLLKINSCVSCFLLSRSGVFAVQIIEILKLKVNRPMPAQAWKLIEFIDVNHLVEYIIYMERGPHSAATIYRVERQYDRRWSPVPSSLDFRLKRFYFQRSEFRHAPI